MKKFIYSKTRPDFDVISKLVTSKVMYWIWDAVMAH